MVTGPGVLTSGGSMGSDFATGGDDVAVSAVVSGAVDVAAGDSVPQARTSGSTAIIKIAINDRLVRRISELISFVRPIRNTSEWLLIVKSAAESTALFLISPS